MHFQVQSTVTEAAEHRVYQVPKPKEKRKIDRGKTYSGTNTVSHTPKINISVSSRPLYFPNICVFYVGGQVELAQRNQETQLEEVKALLGQKLQVLQNETKNELIESQKIALNIAAIKEKIIVGKALYDTVGKLSL